MTVQELLDELNKVEDKNADINFMYFDEVLSFYDVKSYNELNSPADEIYQEDYFLC